MKYPAYILSVVVACMIFFLCILQIPDGTPPSLQIPNLDKVVHILMFFGMAGIIFVEHFKKINKYNWKQMVSFFFRKEKRPFIAISPFYIGFTFLLTGLYGGAIELIQENFTEFRTGDLDDFLADLLGITLAVLLLLHITYHKKKSLNIKTDK
ncbi:MAG: hypothetical protein LUG18_08040 [Candidatus Azobacteroides sp.]|nr:hypothetical protein [Candidatus Azobacteroides sp.]